VVIMGFLLHGDTVDGYGKEAYQQRPVYGINQQASYLSATPWPLSTPELRVHGIAGLRVADAAIMPTVVSGNTNAATIMIGERVADLVREQLRLAA
jgi:hypothetical protein